MPSVGGQLTCPRLFQVGLDTYIWQPNWALCVGQNGRAAEGTWSIWLEDSSPQQGSRGKYFTSQVFKEHSILDRQAGEAFSCPQAACGCWETDCFKKEDVSHFQNVANVHLLIFWKSFRVLKWEERQKCKQVHFLWSTKLSIHFQVHIFVF